MSRHVATIGRQQLPTLFAISPTAVRGLTPLYSGINIGRALSSPWSLSSRAIWNSATAVRHDFPNTYSIVRWSSAATPISHTLRAETGYSVRTRPISHHSRQFISIAGIAQKRWKSNKTPAAEPKPAHDGENVKQASKAPDASKQAPATVAGAKHHLLDHLPHLPHMPHMPHIHRPTKEELLAAATGFWQRLGVRFKWFSIRSARPFRVDEIFAFLSWIFWGHVLWIVIGTTTFFSLLIFTLNTVFAQETLAGWIGEYLTKSSGVKVVFESAIVPTWKDGVITFRNVFVSRRPGKTRTRERAVSKGSSTEAAAAAAAANQSAKDEYDPDENTNYTQFDVTFDTVNVTLSFTKWFNGKGLLQDVEVRGVRGVVDRTFVHWTDEVIDPKSYRHKHNIGDFEIDDFKMSDVLLTLYQPNNFRPFTISIFSCELPRLRKQWLFYDFLSATTMSGSFDNSLFTIHPVQAHGHTGVAMDGGASIGDPRQWKKQSRLRLDGLKIDHLNRGVNGPFSWIQEGNVDIVADITIPRDDDEGIVKVVTDFYDRIEASVANVQTPFHKERGLDYNVIDNNDHEPSTDAYRTHVSVPISNSDNPADSRFIIFDLRVHLNDVRASVPLFTKDLSYVNNALVRPIVAYINSKRAFIPVHCRVVKQQSEFDGSWTIFDSGLLDDLSRETYEAFSRDITDADRTSRRIRKVGLWTLQVAAQALFIGLVGQVA
jgi:distribution and morphology protein 31